MSENRLWQLADELAAELNTYLRLKIEVVDAQTRIEGREPETYDLRAIGDMLKDVYHGAESICKRVATEIDRYVPEGGSSHRELLDQISQLTSTRPAVIQAETKESLEVYRGFRHVFRNVYGFELDWERMKLLLDNAPAVIDAFAADIEQFIAFLRLRSSDQEVD